MAIEKADLVIIGAGPAGLAAAAEVARCHGKVIVLDELSIPGGRLASQIHPEPGQTRGQSKRWSNGSARAAQLVKEAKENGAKIQCGVSVWGIFPDWHVAVTPAYPGAAHNGSPIGYDARAVLIATGATQNPLILPGWTLPGVITAGAAQTMINVHRILPGKKAAIIGIDPLSLSVAQLLGAVGGDVLGVFLPPANGLQFGPSSPQAAIEKLSQFSEYAPSAGLAVLAKLSKYISSLAARCFPPGGIKAADVPLMLRQAALSVDGWQQVEKLTLATLRSNGNVKNGTERQLMTDVVITSAGLSPLVELAQVAGCPLFYIAELGGWVPLHNDRFETPLKGLFVTGSITGVEGAAVAESQGRVAGVSVAAYLELAGASQLERDLKVQKAAVSRARKEAIAFYPDIEAGRKRMASLWPERDRFRSR
jgi:sarcosine oxidase subunit alpha